MEQSQILEELNALIKEGKLGEIYSINAEMSTFHDTEYKKWLQNFGGGIMYILGSHLVDLIVYLLGEPKRIVPFLKHTGLDGVDFEDNNLAVLEYDKALARIFVSSVEVNGFGRRQFMVAGSKGTVNICPLERPITMTYSDTSIADNAYEDRKQVLTFEDNTAYGRYDLPGGSAEALYKSLLRIASLSGDYRLYPGHGREGTLKEEKNYYIR